MAGLSPAADVRLTWTGDAAAYVIERRALPDGLFVAVGIVDGPSYTDPAVGTGTYEYRVAGIDDLGKGPYSDVETHGLAEIPSRLPQGSEPFAYAFHSARRDASGLWTKRLRLPDRDDIVIWGLADAYYRKASNHLTLFPRATTAIAVEVGGASYTVYPAAKLLLDADGAIGWDGAMSRVGARMVIRPAASPLVLGK